jgi:transcriptional regulator with XRE-family HTH domain
MKQTFAAKLKEQREAAGLSQAELAKRAGLHTQAVAKLEQGIRDPAFATVQVLASALGVSVAVFEETAPSSAPAAAVPAKPRGRPRKPPSGDPKPSRRKRT